MESCTCDAANIACVVRFMFFHLGHIENFGWMAVLSDLSDYMFFFCRMRRSVLII